MCLDEHEIFPPFVSLRLRSGHERPSVSDPLRDGERSGRLLVLCVLHGPNGEYNLLKWHNVIYSYKALGLLSKDGWVYFFPSFWATSGSIYTVEL